MQQITVCLWVNGPYKDTVYQSDPSIQSTVIPDFARTAAQILAFDQS